MTTRPEFLATPAPLGAALPWLAHAPRNDAPGWVVAARAAAAESFGHTGLPAPKQEGWQYTPLRALDPAKFSPVPAVFTPVPLPPPLAEDAARVVVVNGRLQPGAGALPEGLEVLPLMEAARAMPGIEEHLVDAGGLAAAPFRALNAAHMQGGVVVKTASDIAQPVEVLFYTAGDVAVHPRVFYWLGENAGLTVLERHMGEGAYFSNPAADICMEPSSRFRLYRYMEEDARAFHFSHTQARLHRAASFESFALAAGGALARQEFRLELLGKDVSAGVSGVYMLKDNQCHDFTVIADHFEPNGKSEQFFRGVADDEARSVFQGKIQVRRPAQGTDGNQSHHALLLSPQAEASVKPELEIYADDVKCAHGAASGQLDSEALFYLRSRGIPEEEAKALLVESFLMKAVEKITHAPARAIAARKVAEWLERRTAA